MALSSGLYLEPSPVDESNIGTVSTSAKDMAPRRPAKIRTICILPSIMTAFDLSMGAPATPQVRCIDRLPTTPIVVTVFATKLENATITVLLAIHANTAITGRIKFQ
eukprot:79155_1